MNIKKLQGKMVEHDISVEMLAARMGQHPSTLYRKFANPKKITVGDAALIRKYVPMSNEDAFDIFLT